ncbi:MAG TPA: hypothetical protein VMS31_19655, partial [Pyrinomonadaceae bacterium]|nr:hypothetical protein [Pyrinomonadaceae bacterium]
MTTNPLDSIFAKLDELKKRFDAGAVSATEKSLARLARKKFTDAETLVRYHELLLFLRTYPSHHSIVTLTEKELSSFPQRVEALRAAEVDISAIETPEISGIAGTSVTDTFTYPIVQWLAGTHRGRVTFEWEWFEDESRLAASWPRFVPLLEEDALVEANVPYETWVRRASGDANGLAWLIERFASLARIEKRSEKEIAELFDAQKLYVRWTLPYRASRTGMRIPVRRIFFHSEPLIQRRDVDLRTELEKSPAPLEHLSLKQGEM